MNKSNIFAQIPDKLPEEVFELIIRKGDLQIERIISKGHTAPDKGWYDEDKNEWVIVLKGAATLSFETEDIELITGDYINIPTHTRHKVSWTDPDTETIWLAIHY